MIEGCSSLSSSKKFFSTSEYKAETFVSDRQLLYRRSFDFSMSARRFENIAFCGYTDSAGGSSPGSQGDGAPSYLPMEVEDQTTQILQCLPQ